MEQSGDNNCGNRKWSSNQNYRALIQFWGRILGEAEKETGMCGHCRGGWVWLSKCQVVAELCVPNHAPTAAAEKIKMPCKCLWQRPVLLNTGKSNGTRQVQTWLLGLSVQNQSFGTSWLLTHLHYSWSAWLFLVSFKIKPARQFPGVQGRSQNAEQM